MRHENVITAASQITGGRVPQSGIDDYRAVSSAIEFLAGHWESQPSLDALAGHLGLSASHTQRLFKRWCGLSPKEFVQAVTMGEARARLDADASVLETALDVGLSGPGRLHDLFVTLEAMTPGEYKRRGAGLELSYGFHSSPFGLALLVASPRGIAGLGFVDEDTAADRTRALDDMIRRWPAATYVERPEVTAPLIEAVFGGRTEDSRAQVRIVLMGSEFDVRVWQALLGVPLGGSTTYSDLASAVGAQGAQRAVGSAVGRNPISFVVPCHRVLRKDGGLGGYHWGVTRKRAIIGWEKGQLAIA